MSTGIDCALFVDGVRFADGCTDDPPTAPAALSGLKIVWGRESTVDQPEASTCDFEVTDPIGGVSFVDVLRTGRRVDVVATGTVYPDPTTPVWPDPSFEAGLPGTVRTNAGVSWSTRRAHTGTHALRLDPIDAARRATVVIGPAPFSAPGTDPDAWDPIPATALGQTWSYGASVFAPAGAVVMVRPVLFTGPYAAAATVVDPALTVIGDGAWHTVEADFTPATAGAWVGLQVATYPTGPTWADLPPDLTWADVDPAWQWADYAAVFVDDVTVLAPAGGIPASVVVFSGRITALESGWADEDDAPVIRVACADFTAELENRQVGDEPWLVETLGTRFARIVALSGMDVTYELDPQLAGTLVTWRDVDAQAANGLLVELAESVDGILWSATHQVTGPYFVLEDPNTRPSLYLLEEGSDGIVRIVPAPALDAAVQLSACDVLREDVTWTQDVSDVITRAAVGWQEQGVDDEGEVETTDRTVTVIDTALEVTYGSRRLSLTTQLQDEDDARTVARRLLDRTSDTDWRAAGLAIDDAELDAGPDDVERLLTLLDGTSRNGRSIQLTDLPPWAPAPGGTVGVHLEGGTYTFADGAWILELGVSNYAGQGASATWADLDPSWRWVDFDPSITWADLHGVGVTP